jgi:hypothetical protein
MAQVGQSRGNQAMDWRESGLRPTPHPGQLRIGFSLDYLTYATYCAGMNMALALSQSHARSRPDFLSIIRILHFGIAHA